MSIVSVAAVNIYMLHYSYYCKMHMQHTICCGSVSVNARVYCIEMDEPIAMQIMPDNSLRYLTPDPHKKFNSHPQQGRQIQME